MTAPDESLDALRDAEWKAQWITGSWAIYCWHCFNTIDEGHRADCNINRLATAVEARVRAEVAAEGGVEADRDLSILRDAAKLAREVLRPVRVEDVRRVMSPEERTQEMLARSMRESEAFDALNVALGEPPAVLWPGGEASALATDGTQELPAADAGSNPAPDPTNNESPNQEVRGW